MSPHEKDDPGDIWPITYRFADSKEEKNYTAPKKPLKECRENTPDLDNNKEVMLDIYTDIDWVMC